MNSNFIRTRTIDCYNADTVIKKLFWYSTKQGNAAKRKRAKRSKASSPAVKALNDKRSRELFEAFVANNFFDGDPFFSLTFTPELSDEEREKEFCNFLDRLERVYEKHNAMFKWLYTAEHGEKNGNLHFHVFLGGGVPFEEILACWKRSRRLKGRGNCDIQALETDENGVLSLSYYLEKQWSIGAPNRRKWNASRNLDHPDVEANDDETGADDVRKILTAVRDDEIAKTVERMYPDYRLISIDLGVDGNGINPVTGGAHLQLRLVKRTRTKTDNNSCRPRAPVVFNSAQQSSIL